MSSKKKKPEKDWWVAWEWLTGKRTNPTALEFFTNLIRCKRVVASIKAKDRKLSAMHADIVKGRKFWLWW